VHFETVLPRLSSAFETGRLVPFIGSGMSIPVCSDWNTFVRTLESAAQEKDIPAYPDTTSREELIRRANNAVRTLKAREPGTFERAVERALIRTAADSPIPPQTLALAGLPWPLVLSTNYDNLYAAAMRERFPERELAVVGRSVEDCQRVLNSLSVAGRPIVWALQGYLDVPHGQASVDATRRLRGQLVVGHEEYRRVTYRDLHFRRAFAEVFRQRSLLFLGAGIQETYMQELFGEVLEHYGPGSRPHYAFIQQGEVDPDFMLARFQIIALEYPHGEHRTVVHWLDALADHVHRPPSAPVAWDWGRVVSSPGGNGASVPDFQVVRGPLPARLNGECLAVSAGGSGRNFYFSAGIRHAMEAWDIRAHEKPVQVTDYLGEFPGRDVYAVRARNERDERSLSSIYDASLELFERIADRYRGIRIQLLASGGTDKLEVSGSTWKVRNYPERFSFVQTVRAWAAWRKGHPQAECRLTMHVVLESVYHDIASGRIDVLELLSCRDIRFFVEVLSGTGDIERRLFQLMPDTKLHRIVEQLQLSPEHWTVEVTPPPTRQESTGGLLRERLSDTLQELGVLPGSTLHFRRSELARIPSP
jgi:hypothetical protein